MSKYSVEEVQSMASDLRAAPGTSMIGTHISLPTAKAVAIYEVLCSYAERIKADEGVVPVAWQRKRRPDDYPDEWRECSKETFDTIKRTKDSPWIVRELFDVLPNLPAQAAQLWEMKQRACRAHALCNELRLAHPEIPELGDDGVLHEAIHDILRVDTPTAAPAQMAQVDVIGHPRGPNEQRDEIELYLRDAYAAGCHSAQSRSMVTAMEYAHREAPKLRAIVKPTAEPVAQSVDVEKVREVIAHLRKFDSPYTRGLADKLTAALQEKGNG